MDRVLDIRDLSVTYHSREKSVFAVNRASFHLDQGDALGVVGESGSGKSTLAMAVLRLLPARIARVEGKVLFLGKDWLAASEEEVNALRWKEISVVFQKSMNSFSPVHRIGDQIEDIYRVHEPKATRKEILDKASELLRLVNLNERVYRLYPHELSGGMLQRISIAVSLLHRPSLLILDEATTALDVVTQGQILAELTDMARTLKTSRIMVTHDISVVASSCNLVAVMYAGHVVERGPTSSVLKEPLHPYTKGLLSSFPSLRGEKTQLRAIPGFLPDLSKRYEGCIFAPRCPRAMDVCSRELPYETAITEDHSVVCHLYGGDVS
jgi:peptide/nickel transport system ATP-binding protein